MRITVRVKPNSREDKVEKTGDKEFSLRVRAGAIEGRANEAVVKVLSEYFSVAKSRIRILKGLAGRIKIVEIV